MRKKIPFLFFLFLSISCSGLKKTTVQSPPETEVRHLDTLVVSDDPRFEELPDSADIDVPNTLPVYQASHRRIIDIIHTDLDISFEWENEEVIGTALITLSPYFCLLYT